jgi:ribosomal protein L19
MLDQVEIIVYSHSVARIIDALNGGVSLARNIDRQERTFFLRKATEGVGIEEEPRDLACVVEGEGPC